MMVNTIEPAHNLRFRLSVVKPPHLLDGSVVDEVSRTGFDYKIYQLGAFQAEV